MRILLTRPNSRIPISPLPMGLMYLASALRGHGHDVRIFDGRERRASHHDFSLELEAFRPQAVGISAFTIEWTPFHDLARVVKQWDPGVKVIGGGPHVWARKERVLEDPAIDHALVGPGELSAPELVAAYAQGREPREIGGLCWREGGEHRYDPRWAILQSLDDLPFPAYDLVDVERYTHSARGHTQHRLQLRKRAFPIFTTRGCPYACDFCHKIFGRKLYKRSAAHVLHEVDILVGQYGMKEMHISDDIFNADLVHAKSVLRAILSRPYRLKIAFPNGLRTDRVDGELVDLMKRAGTFRVIYAIETGSAEVQRRIGKNLRLDVAKEAIRRTVAAGIHTSAFFMLGHADETRDEMDETVRFALESDLNAASFFFATPFPDTDLYRKAIERGVSEEQLERLYKESIGMDFGVLAVNLTRVPTAEIVRLKQRALAKFYFSFTRILSNVARMPDPRVLRRTFVYVLRHVILGKTHC